MFRYLLRHIITRCCLFVIASSAVLSAEREVQFVPHHGFANDLRAKMLAFNREFTNFGSTPSAVGASCPKAQLYVEHILQRLIDGSDLRRMVAQGDFPVTVAVACTKKRHA